MWELSRTVRFCISDVATDTSDGKRSPPPQGVGFGDDSRGTSRGTSGGTAGGGHNTYSAYPPVRGLDRYYELEVTCRGVPERVTGYLVSITRIDAAVRQRVVPMLTELVQAGGGGEVPLGAVLQRMQRLLRADLGRGLWGLRLRLTPFVSLEIRSADMSHVILRQQFEFAAAHRLHAPGLTAQQNRATFGKCNNPAGHGHNYQVEVAVRVPIDKQGHTLAVAELDQVVEAAVLAKLDHKHLNVDVPAFARRNPSVENITRVIHGWLKAPLRRHRAELVEVRVWETAKTVCTYRGK